MRRLAGAALIAIFGATAAWAGPTVRPGGWTHQLTIQSATIPGIPGFLIPKNRPRTHKSCLAAADAARNPGVLLVGEKMSCTPRRFTMAEGRISSIASCVDERLGTPMTVQSTGTYTATSYSIRSVSTGVRKGRPLHIETVSTGTLTHAC